MQRKILGICAALVAFGALAVAPTMAAGHTLQDTSGGLTAPIKTGASIVGDSTGTAFLKGSGLTVECNENIFTGTVHKNDGNEIQGTITHAWFQSNLNESGTLCKSNLGATTVTIPDLTNGAKATKHWCIRTIPNTDNWELNGRNCTEEGAGELTFILDVAGIQCKYKRTTAVKGTFTTETNGKHETSTFLMSNDAGKEGVEFTKHEGGFLCPAVGLLSNFDFDMYTDSNTSNVYGAQPTANPVWIKEGV